MSDLRETLAETRALLRRLLEEQTIAERVLNEQRIAVGLKPKPFVSSELRDAIAEADAEAIPQAGSGPEEVRAETESETKPAASVSDERAEEEQRMSRRQDH